MLQYARNLLAAHAYRVLGFPQRNSARLYDGRRGLRIATLHDTGTLLMPGFRRLLDWCEQRFERGTAADAAALVRGAFVPGKCDKLLFTFDDGHDNNLLAAQLLAERGWQAVFFIVPPYLNRSIDEYCAFHHAQGVEAVPFGQKNVDQPVHGLSDDQVRSMVAMGHVAAGHNYAHRDLGALADRAELEYEIGRALDDLSLLTGQPCTHFAWGNGTPRHLSDAAIAYLNERGVTVYSSVRGLNVPGTTPTLLLRDAVGLPPLFPEAWSKLLLLGGVDHRYLAARENLTRRGGTLPAGVAG